MIRTVTTLALAAALLGACAGQTMISKVEIAENYEPTEQGFLGGEKALMPTEFWNNTLPGAEAGWRKSLETYKPGTPLKFVPVNGLAKEDIRQRFVLLLAAPKTMVDGTICALKQPPVAAKPAADEPYLWRAAYCVGERTVNEATGVLSAPPVAGGDTVAPLLPQISQALFPTYNRNKRERSCALPSC